MKKYILLISFVFAFISLPAQPDGGSKGSYGVNVTATEESALLELKVFPNPVLAKKFTIEPGSSALKEIRIINIAGKQVYDMKFLSPVHRFEANVGDLPNGVYLLKVNTVNNMSKTIKLLIRSSL